MRKIYLASSWRNQKQSEVLAMLKEMGHDVYDFKNPMPGNTGFGWQKCKYDLTIKDNYIHHISTDKTAALGFKLDRDALNWCDTCIMLLPCGRSAHLEAGYAIGQGKETIIVLSDDEKFEPELMYLLADHIYNLKVCLQHCKEEIKADTTYGW
jgi:nucleoside 2-deoxyribosyltransferase